MDLPLMYAKWKVGDIERKLGMLGRGMTVDDIDGFSTETKEQYRNRLKRQLEFLKKMIAEEER